MSNVLLGLQRGEFHVAYQPQVGARDGLILAVEALVRWTDPMKGPISPAAFIPGAEASGAIKELGAFVLRRACEDAVRWPSLTVGVNASPVQFNDPDFVDSVLAMVADAGLPPDRLEIEITEGSFFDDPAGAERELRRLRAAGIKIALDDFGTGYSSLSYLRRLPFTKVKIDKSFIDEVETVSSASIVHAVIALARAMGLKVTAEGVETPIQRDFLKVAGCHFLQGFLFSRAVAAEMIDEMLDQQAIVRPARVCA